MCKGGTPRSIRNEKNENTAAAGAGSGNEEK
jgi:hypothetical protein